MSAHSTIEAECTKTLAFSTARPRLDRSGQYYTTIFNKNSQNLSKNANIYPLFEQNNPLL